jgi:predicted ATP-binding protein involved in virulence
MKETQDEIFQAFIVAILQQTEPLPATVQSEFNQTDENYTITDILRLTKLHPPLLAAYQTNRVWLKNHSSQRSKGPRPNAEFEINNTTNTETDNTASDIRDLPDLPKILNQIKTKVQPRGLREFLIKILQAGDSVQASRDRILVSIADGFVHE